jgi:4-diphosphocytidyl-2-C-methyl-D-erythritol kinase
MLAAGRGEVVTSLPPLPKCYVILAKPPVSVSTAWAYGNFKKEEAVRPDLDAMRTCLAQKDLMGVAGLLGNALESVTRKAHPEIALLKERLLEYGSLAAMMSGSGPTVFGLVRSEKEGTFILERLRAADELGCEFFLTETVDAYYGSA